MFSASEHGVKRNVHHQCDDAAKGLRDSQGMAKKSDKKTKAKGPGDFGRNLKERRGALRMTIDVLADRARVSRSYISSLETGARRNPSEGMARMLARALECDVATLWGGSQDAFESRALELLRKIPEDRRESAIASLYGLASQVKAA